MAVTFLCCHEELCHQGSAGAQLAEILASEKGMFLSLYVGRNALSAPSATRFQSTLLCPQGAGGSCMWLKTEASYVSSSQYQWSRPDLGHPLQSDSNFNSKISLSFCFLPFYLVLVVLNPKHLMPTYLKLTMLLFCTVPRVRQS